MSRLVFERDLENKRNAGAFIGDFGSALISLWGKEVTEAMKQASENSGWSRFQKLLKFVVIKAVEWTLAAGLTPAGAAFFEALEVSISEHVIEKATEAGFGYYMENAAEKREEAAKSSKIERKKESLDKITDQFADLMRTLPNDTLSSLPSGDPYIEWLRLAPLDDLRKFRLPPLFPRVNSSEIRATVAGLIAGLLHVPLKVESAGLCIGLQCAVPDPEKVEYYDDDIIVVREMRDAQIYSPSPAIVKAIAGQVPISQVPLVPLYISNGGPRADAAAAELLLTALRGYGAVSQQEKEDFVKAYAEPGEVTVTRLFGEIEVTGHSLAGDLKLYMVGSGDSRLVDLSREVLTWAHGEAEYRRNIGSAPDEGVSRLADVADLAAKTRFYLEEANDKQRLAWAKALITNEIEKLVPQTPVDRYR
jgi:hypothetical protein